MSGGGEGEATLEFTPTWVVAILCTVIVVISLGVERLIHYTGKYLKRTDKKPLYQALEKIKEELMIMGFISLLLTVFQGKIGGWCITEDLANKWLPCKKEIQHVSPSHGHATNHALVHEIRRQLLSAAVDSTYCQKKGKVPLLSLTALHHLHIFIFVLAVVHVIMCALTVLFGGIKISQWKPWEESIQKKEHDLEDDTKIKLTLAEQHDFIKGRFRAVHCRLLGWLQFYGSVTESDYITMRMGFITTHCKGNARFNFHKYMIRAFESDFKKVVGISLFLWLFVVVFLFLNVNGYHAYFWIAFIPLILLLAVGTKLEHIIIQLATEVAQRHSVIVGHVVIKPSDDHFWFHKPRLLLLLIHIILFANSFELAFFFWIWVQYGFDSCIMGSIGYTIPRLATAVFVQLLCSYSTLPLYAIVTQMGSSFNKAIFEDYIHEGLVDWAHKAKRTRAKPMKLFTNGSGQGTVHQESASKQESIVVVETPVLQQRDDSTVGEIQPAQMPQQATQ